MKLIVSEMHNLLDIYEETLFKFHYAIIIIQKATKQEFWKS